MDAVNGNGASYGESSLPPVLTSPPETGLPGLSLAGAEASSAEPPASPPERRPLRAPATADEISRIPKAVVKRLSLYSRVLTDLEMSNVEKISSQELAEQLGFNSAQVRKDLAYFGQFGVPGFGYYVTDLRSELKRILRTDREVRVALIGVGNLGSALIGYGGFSRQGFKVVMAFDADPARTGVTRGDVEVYPIEELEKRLADSGVDIAILAVPPDACQEMADRLVSAGVGGILNFVPRRLVVPKEVKVHYVDLAIELESLSYYLK